MLQYLHNRFQVQTAQGYPQKKGAYDYADPQLPAF
jgi:hypothetical protein